MSDLAEIAAELRKVLPTEHWHLVDKLVDYLIDSTVTAFNRNLADLIREAFYERFP